MLKRIPISATPTGLAPARLALAGLTLAGALCACGSATQDGVSPAPISGVPIIFAVRLDGAFQPRTLRISPGQHFVVNVDSSVKASGPGVPRSCSSTTAPIDGGMLTVRCMSGVFYYTAQRPGTAELMATVRPNCAPGSMCPQWITEATLKITIL
jgi:hypothetical protein